MKMEYRKVNDGIVQLTLSDERWYTRLDDNDQPVFVPSNTWICSYYPKGKGYEQWLKNKGDEAEDLKKEAGNKGSKVHRAIEDLLKGNEVKLDAKYMNHDSGREEELTADEYLMLMDFCTWWNDLNSKHDVKVLSVESTIWNDEIGVAATLDLKLMVDGKIWIVDFKTSAAIYMSHKLQLCFMKRTENADQAFILQLGYKLNKNRYKLTELEEDLWEEYLATKTIWARETAGVKPLQRDYPMSLKVEVKNEEI